MIRTLYIAVSILLGLLLFSAGVRGQDTSAQPDKPLPPDTLNTKNDASQEEADAIFPIDTPKVVPDTRPLAGAQALTLGTVSKTRSFILPSFTAMAQWQKSPYLSSSSNNSDTSFNGFVGGRLALNEISQNSSLLLDYLAGGSFAKNYTLGNSLIQNLDFAYTLHRGRWTTMLGDEFSYLSAAPFGFGGIGGLGSLGIALGNGVGSSPGFLTNFAPSQSLFLNGAARISNSVIGQEDYALSHRSSLTIVGSYGVLKFIDAGFEDGSNVSLQAGYNYAVSRKDIISVSYQFNRFVYFNAPPKILNHVAQFAYARRLTGRVTFQVSGGPQFQDYQDALTETGNAVGWSLYSSLFYDLGRTGFSASYSHGQTGGSGIFLGAETDLAQGMASHKFSRDWDGSLMLGYSRNNTLRQTTTVDGTASPQAWFATGQLNRHFIRYGSLFVSYTISRQSSLSSFCSLPSCNAATSHFVSVGYTWGLRPVVL